MRVWTNGGIHLVVDDRGLAIHREGAAPEMLRRFEGGSRKRGGTVGWAKRHILAVLDDGPMPERVIIGGDGRVMTLTLPEATPRVFDGHILDAVGIGEGRALVCLSRVDDDGERRAKLAFGESDDGELAIEEELELPKIAKIAWPGGIWQKGAEAWPENEEDSAIELEQLGVAWTGKDPGFFFDPVILDRNAHGVAVAARYSGIVAVLRPGAKAIDFAVRVPTQPEAEIFASATPKGVLVSLCIEGRESALLHLGKGGEVLGHVSKLGKELLRGTGPVLLVTDDKALIYAGGILEVALDSFELRTRGEALGIQVGGELCAATSLDGATGMLGLGSSAHVIRRGGRGRVRVEALAPPPEPVAPPPPPSMDTVKGPPALALARIPEQTSAWESRKGESFAVELGFTSAGGAGKGVYVEVGGQALADGLVSPKRVEIDDHVAEFAKKGGIARAELPAVALAAALALPEPRRRGPPLEPQPDPTRARVEFDAVKNGAGLLTVRVGPLGAEPGRGSALQGKRVVIG